MKRRIVLNSFSQASLFVVNLVVTFLLSPVIIRELGNRNYGIWEILLSVFGYLSLLDLGVSPAFLRFVAHATARHDRLMVNRIVTSALLFLSGIGLLGFVTMNVVAHYSGGLLNIAPGSVTNLRLVALFIGITSFVQFSGMVFSTYLQGLQRHYFVNSVQIVLAIIRGVVTYLALTRWAGSGLVWLAAILAGHSVLRYGTYAVRVLLLSDAPVISRRFLSWKALKELYAFGVKSLTLMISARVSLWSVPIIIGWILGAAQVVFYAIPNRLTVYAAGLGASIGFPLMPYFSSLDGKGDREQMRRSWFELSRWLQFIMVGMAVATLGLGVPFIRRWIGPEYAEGGRWVVRFLSLALVVEAFAPNANRLLVSMNRHGKAAVYSLVVALCGLPLTVGLAKLGGIPGVAVAVMIVRSATQGVMLVLACRALSIPVREHFLRTMVPFAPAGILALLVAAGLRILRNPQGYGTMILYGLAIALVYGVVTWVSALTAEEKRAVSAFLSDRARRLVPARS